MTSEDKKITTLEKAVMLFLGANIMGFLTGLTYKTLMSSNEEKTILLIFGITVTICWGLCNFLAIKYFQESIKEANNCKEVSMTKQDQKS